MPSGLGGRQIRARLLCTLPLQVGQDLKGFGILTRKGESLSDVASTFVKYLQDAADLQIAGSGERQRDSHVSTAAGTIEASASKDRTQVTLPAYVHSKTMQRASTRCYRDQFSYHSSHCRRTKLPDARRILSTSGCFSPWYLASCERILFTISVAVESTLLGDGFDPVLVLLNNDLTAGVPPQLQEMHGGQAVLPPLTCRVARAAQEHAFPPPRGRGNTAGVAAGSGPLAAVPSFKPLRRPGLRRKHRVAAAAARGGCTAGAYPCPLRRARHRAAPFVVVKADNGTYGMGIMTLRDAAELSQLGCRALNKMHVIKDGRQTSDVIVQVGGGTADTVVSLVNRKVAGAFHRVHAERGTDQNLNAPGARFVPLAEAADTAFSRFYLYAVAARLAALAAAHELQAGDTAQDAMPPRPASRCA